jgi:hypothetical protein
MGKCLYNPHILDLALLGGVSGQLHASTALLPGKDPPPHTGDGAE